jgi:tRNA pseudouridine55 synthase
VQGFLNINKPAGMTSHDVVSVIRRIMQTKRVGHGGTLDPDAQGVLVVAVGTATRALQYLEQWPKIYRAQLELGSATDTQDSSGQKTMFREDLFSISRAQLLAVLDGFLGHSEQIPPMYSAIKIGGQKLYEAARRGVIIERQPRPIKIESITLLDQGDTWGPGARISIRVTCSPGTYIRTLCHDIGIKLGCYAHMTHLLRERSGIFRVEDAVPLDLLRDALQPATAASSAAATAVSTAAANHLIDINEALAHLPAVRLSANLSKRVLHGNAVKLGERISGRCRLQDAEGKILAIAESREIGPDGVTVSPICVFSAPEE